MQTLIVKTESEAATKLLLAFLKTVRLVKSVTLVSSEVNAGVVNEPATSYNWINPSRPATDEEIELMLNECEASSSYTSDEVMDFVKAELKEWRKKKK